MFDVCQDSRAGPHKCPVNLLIRCIRLLLFHSFLQYSSQISSAPSETDLLATCRQLATSELVRPKPPPDYALFSFNTASATLFVRDAAIYKFPVLLNLAPRSETAEMAGAHRPLTRSHTAFSPQAKSKFDPVAPFYQQVLMSTVQSSSSCSHSKALSVVPKNRRTSFTGGTQWKTSEFVLLHYPIRV
jgi:hypothetical protein